MTHSELKRLLNIRTEKLTPAIKECAKTIPSIAEKFIDGNIYVGSQFNLTEIKAILDKLKMPKIAYHYIEENYKDMPDVDIITIRGTNEFIENFKSNKYIQCCNTCKYLKGMKEAFGMPKPFCNVYKNYLYKFKANVYKDYCTSYEYIELPKPRKWYKDNAPKNLNIFGDTNTVNGIDKNIFLSGEECKGKPVELVNQVGFD